MNSNKTKTVIIDFCRKYKQLSASIGIILVGLLLAVLMIMTRSKPAKVDFPELAPLVETEILEPCDIEMVVKGYGTVKPKSEVQIVPQVSGRVISMSPEFRSGGYIKAGRQLFQIEPRDFSLVVEQAQAKVAEAEVNLDLEKSEAAVAKREWQQINPGTEPDSALVLREPQIRQARAALDSAKAALAKAKLDLERTSIALPIDVCITVKNVDLGQFITTGTSVGSAYGIDAVEIEVPLEDSELMWFDMSDSSAQVKAVFAGMEKIFKGVIKRTTGRVDEASRLIYVVVEVKNPLKLAPIGNSLIPGMFVEVNIKGRTFKNAFAVRRDWLHNATEIWTVENGILHIEEPNIVRTDDKFAYISQGSDSRIEVVTSNIDTVVDGMKIRVTPGK